MELAIDACLGLARHLVAGAGLRPPATYAETFVIAGEAELIDPALTETLVRMCGLRNGSFTKVRTNPPGCVAAVAML